MNFRKIVAHLAYSPAMIWHLAAYDTKIKNDKSKNFKIILFAILNLIIIAVAISNSHNHQSVIHIPGMNTKTNNFTLSNRPLTSNEAQARHFSKNSFFTEINNHPQLVQVYNHFKINYSSVKNMQTTLSPSSFNNCSEINYSPLDSLGQININPNLTVYIHKCQKQYYGLAIQGQSETDFIILNNGNLLLRNVDTKTTKPLAFNIKIVNSTTNIQSPREVNPGESVKYTLTATNISSQPFDNVAKINLSDISEYAQILNNSLNSDQAIYWKINNLQPGQDISYDIYAKADYRFSSQPLNLNSLNSHDCKMSLGLGDTTVSTQVNCNLAKKAELLAHKHVPPSRHDHKILISVLLFLLIVIVLKILHIARINFISKEIRIIRHKINQGII